MSGVPSPDAYVDLYFDVDRNIATGDQGVEFVIYLNGSDLGTYAERWTGSSWVEWVPPSGRAGYQNGIWTVAISRTDLNGTNAFDFYFIGSKWAGEQEIGRDDAPDGTAVYTYTISQTPPPPPPPPPPPRPEPKSYEDAPKLPPRIMYVGKSIKHVRLGEKLYRTMKRLGAPRVVAVACWSQEDWPSVLASADIGGNPNAIAGFWLDVQPRWIHIAPKQCADVQALMLSRAVNARRAYALGTVLHERVHAQVRLPEAQTECYAVQLVYEFARELNFVHRLALRLEQLAVRKSRALAPSGYWNRALCRDGGSWDLYPELRNLDY